MGGIVLSTLSGRTSEARTRGLTGRVKPASSIKDALLIHHHFWMILLFEIVRLNVQPPQVAA